VATGRLVGGGKRVYVEEEKWKKSRDQLGVGEKWQRENTKGKEGSMVGGIKQGVLKRNIKGQSLGDKLGKKWDANKGIIATRARNKIPDCAKKKGGRHLTEG